MDKTSDLPMALWKANLDLQARLARLLQEDGREWLELGTRAMGDSASGFETEARRLLQAGDWQALAALPVEAFWRQAEQGLGDSQAVVQRALQGQEAFARGLAEALQDWQRQMAEAWQVAGAPAAPAGTSQAWTTMLDNLQRSFAAMMPASPAGKGPGTRGG